MCERENLRKDCEFLLSVMGDDRNLYRNVNLYKRERDNKQWRFECAKEKTLFGPYILFLGPK